MQDESDYPAAKKKNNCKEGQEVHLHLLQSQETDVE